MALDSIYDQGNAIMQLMVPINHQMLICPRNLGSHSAFSHDVTAAILLFQNNRTAAMLVF